MGTVGPVLVGFTIFVGVIGIYHLMAPDEWDTVTLADGSRVRASRQSRPGDSDSGGGFSSCDGGGSCDGDGGCG
jgi:hypothetical protein